MASPREIFATLVFSVIVGIVMLITSFRLTDDAGTSQLNFDSIIIGIIIFCLIVAILLIVYFFKIKKEKDPQTTEKKPTQPKNNMKYVSYLHWKFFCRYCGKDNVGDTIFCKKCGKKIK